MISRRLIAFFSLLITTLPASAGDWSLESLMQARQAVETAEARFIQERHSFLLDEPLRSEGRLHYRASDVLKQEITAPYPSTLSLAGDRLTLEKDGESRSISLSQYPEAGRYVNALRGVLSGDLAMLKQHFELEFAGDKSSWSLALLPRDDSVYEDRAQAFGPQIERIDFRGRAAMLTQIEMKQSASERTLMNILDDTPAAAQ